MKKLILILTFLSGVSFALSAQYQYPPYSPSITIRQQLGYTNVTIETTRPMARGRKIFGGLVPYDKLWQTGAGGSFITFDQDVMIAGQLAPASRYSLRAIPGEKEWTVILSRNSVMPDSPDYDHDKEIKVCIPVKKTGRFYEAWTVELDMTPNSGQLYLSWTDVQVNIPIETGSEKRTMAFIDSLVAAPLTSDHEEYYRAVNYLNFNKKKMDKVVLFTKHIITLEKEERYDIYETLAEAYQYLGETEKAVTALKKVEEILPRQFPGQTETIDIISARVKRKLEKAGKME